MPSLVDHTLERSQDTSPGSISHSRSASPVRPPYSPITPTLSSARLTSASTSNNAPQANTQPRQTYTHSQPKQTAIPQPQPIPIVVFDENPDVLALKSAASILQIQAQNAVRDIQTLQRIKKRAQEDPVEFTRALETGEIKTRGDDLFNPGESYDDEDEVEDEGEQAAKEGAKKGGKEKWEALPTPQNVVRCPPINWNQYAIVGEPLDKLHKDQLERPVEGVPQRVGSDGQLIPGGDGVRRQAALGVAAPYQPGKDKIEKMGTRKGGKR